MMSTKIQSRVLLSALMVMTFGALISTGANAASVMPGAYDTAIQTGLLTGPTPHRSRSVTLVKPGVYDTAIIEGSLEQEITVSGAGPSGNAEFAVMEPEAGQPQPYWELDPSSY
jgi:hypothetical protein